LSLPHVTAGAAAAAAQRAAEQRSSQRTNLSPDSDFQSGRSRHYWPRQCRQHSSFENARLKPP
jgi:hypothetical protein